MSGNGTNAITKKSGELTAEKALLVSLERSRARLEAVIPSGVIDPMRFFEMAVGLVRADPKLHECDQTSVLMSMFGAAKLGLSLDPAIGHAYILPFGKKIPKRAQLIVGYKGYQNLARRSGKIAAMHAEVVYENDLREVHFGTNRGITHRPWFDCGFDEPGKPVFAYCTWLDLASGTPEFRVATRDRIERAFAASPSSHSDFSPWQNDPMSMWKKTAVIEASKMLPLTVEMSLAVQWDEEAERGAVQSISPMLDDDAHPPASAGNDDPLLLDAIEGGSGFVEGTEAESKGEGPGEVDPLYALVAVVIEKGLEPGDARSAVIEWLGDGGLEAADLADGSKLKPALAAAAKIDADGWRSWIPKGATA